MEFNPFVDLCILFAFMAAAFAPIVFKSILNSGE